MTTTQAFKDKDLMIYVNSDNKMSIPLEYAKGNIGNVMNFIIYIFMNSGMEWIDIYSELSSFVHHKIGDIEFDHNIKSNDTGKENLLKNTLNMNDGQCE